MVRVCIHPGMAATGVMRPERTSEGRSRIKESTTDCWSVFAQAEMASARPTMLVEKSATTKKRSGSDPAKGMPNHQRQTAKMRKLWKTPMRMGAAAFPIKIYTGDSGDISIMSKDPS